MNPWIEEPEPGLESRFTSWADDGWHAWNVWSPEVEFCDWVGQIVAATAPELVVETGVGQGFTTRRILANLPTGAEYVGYESDQDWRNMIGPAAAAYSEEATISYEATPDLATVADADLIVLDSEWTIRIAEFRLWLEHGKPGSDCIIHDTGTKHAPTSMHMKLGRIVAASGIQGETLGNPRGSWHGTKPN